jgi:hypothetical protein
LAHYLGDHTFDDRRSPRDHFITAILSLGEGYHNFHHEFPQDYRNAIKFYQYDPTKWLIKTLSYVGLTHHLKKFPDNEIKKGIFLMEQKKLDQKNYYFSGVKIFLNYLFSPSKNVSLFFIFIFLFFCFFPKEREKITFNFYLNSSRRS